MWSGDTAGQGWGIDAARGGMRTYATMQRNRPDFFIHSGDTIYADGPLAAEVKLPDGSLWNNLVTEEKSEARRDARPSFAATTNTTCSTGIVRAFNAEVPMFAQWDDHEVTNNWWPDEPLTGEEHHRLRYRETNARVLMERASRAFHEFMPIRRLPAEPGRVYRKIAYGPLLDVFMLDMRSYRGPNGDNREASYGPAAYLFGPQQIAWLKRELQHSRATWKVIAADMPLGLIVYDDFVRKWGAEGIGLGRWTAARPRARIRRPARLHQARAACATPCGSPPTCITPPRITTIRDKAVFQDFEPFWEFVSGPMHAGSLRSRPRSTTPSARSSST